MRISGTWSFVFPLLIASGCAYDQGRTGYGGTSTPGGEVISSPGYTVAPAVSAPSAPPVYSVPPAPGVSVTPPPIATAPANALVSQVQQAFRNSDISGLAPNINVSAQNGTVTLTGFVPTERERQLAETLARNTSGVLTVNNDLRVLRAPNALNPGAYPPSPSLSSAAGDVFSLHVQGLNEPDRALAQRILNGLRTDSALSAMLPSVNIFVSGGRVVLQGQVQSDQQRQTIESVVRQAAATSNIDDQLQVVNGPATSPNP